MLRFEPEAAACEARPLTTVLNLRFIKIFKNISSYKSSSRIRERPSVLHLDDVDIVAAFCQQREGAALYVPPVAPEKV